MSRASRIPYHQNVYDLLGIEPSECPDARRMIEEHETEHGPLPASVREWYLVPKMVMLKSPAEETPEQGYVWFDASPVDSPTSLEDVLNGFVRAIKFKDVWPYVRVLTDRGVGAVGTCFIQLTDSDDPPVLYDPEGTGYTDGWHPEGTFSEFVALNICVPKWSLWNPDEPRAEGRQSMHRNGLWLRVPDEPFQPPVIDFLIDHFGEPERTPRTGDVTTYTFRPPGGIIRITADEPALAGGLSAWWVHAETAERLAEFARLLLPWGTLRETLRADTDPARDVLKLIRESGVG